MIHYVSTKGKSPPVTFKEAVLTGLAPDGGLYLPEPFPKLPLTLLSQFSGWELSEIAASVAPYFVGDSIPRAETEAMVREALTFPAPLVELDSDLAILELFHGPSLAFKDFGAQFMAAVMSYFIKRDDRELTVLVATSGDTGSAIAAGFHGRPGVKVVILYPDGQVSQIQEKQLNSFGGNVTTLKVRGSFDDCQRMVKSAFIDREVTDELWLTSANSINVARLVPQSFYYLYAASRRSPKQPFVFVVPSGNFGNLTAGIFAARLGIKVHQFVAGTNINDSVPRYLASGHFTPHASHRTISNAMDVGNPSNFSRLLALYDNNWEKMRNAIIGVRVNDETTKDTIREIQQRYDYLLDPHTAVGVHSYFEYRQQSPKPGIVLGTAHPAKFKDIVDAATGTDCALPPVLQEALEGPSFFETLEGTDEALKEFLLS